MKRLCLAAVFAAVICTGAPAAAHPAPFSFVDLRIESSVIDITAVVHVFDVAHELDIQPPDRLLDPAVLKPQAERLAALLRDRLQVVADGQQLTINTWLTPEPLPTDNRFGSVRATTSVAGRGFSTSWPICSRTTRSIKRSSTSMRATR